MQPEERLIDQAVELARSGHVRHAAHMLRERLTSDPRNIRIREALAEVYRVGGHPEQAARYLLAFGHYDAETAEPYLRWLAATGADEARIRRLSALPEDVAIPHHALDRLQEIHAAPVAHEPWDTLSMLGGLAFALLGLLTLIVVYVVVLAGGDFGRAAAAIGGAATTGALAVGALGIAGSSWKSGGQRVAAISASVSVAALTLCVLAALAVVLR